MPACPPSWHGGVLTHYTPQLVLQNCDPVLWVVVSIVGFTIPWYLWARTSFPQQNVCVPSNNYAYSTLPGVYLDASADVHGRSRNFLLIHPREVLLARHWGTALPLLSCAIFTSFGSGLVWGGAGTSVPCMVDTYTQGNANLWCDEKKSVSVEDMWPSMLVHHFVGGDICHNLMYHLTYLPFPPLPDLPLSLKGISLH